jgi:AcrR family transcriptional regulator
LLVGAEVNNIERVTSRPLRAARRKSPEERRAEIVAAAAAIALDEGLEKVTAKRVAHALGVFPGLVTHYFPTADELVTAAFAHGTARDHEEAFGIAEAARTPLEQLRRLLRFWLNPEFDAISLLWLDAWQASRRRPMLAEAVAEQMRQDRDRLAACIARGVAAGDFVVNAPAAAATQILSLVDALSVQAATRDAYDYRPVQTMAISTVERILSLDDGVLAGLARRNGRSRVG